MAPVMAESKRTIISVLLNALCGIALCGIALLSCHQPTGGTAAAVANADAATAPTPGMLTLRLSFGGAKQGERTVRPSLASLSFEKITVRLYLGGAVTSEKTLEQGGTLAELSVQFDLQGPGTYTFEAAGYRYAADTYPLVRGRGTAALTDDDITNGINMTVELALSEEAAAAAAVAAESGDTGAGTTGSISLSVEWETSGLTLNAVLYKLDMTTEAGNQSGITSSSTVDFADIPAGNYFLTLEFKRGDVTAGYFIEAVTVFPGLVSNRWAGLDNVDHDSLEISQADLRNSAANIYELDVHQMPGDTRIDLSGTPADTNRQLSAASIPEDDSLRITVTCLSGQSISPLTWGEGATAESVPVGVSPVPNVYYFEFTPPGGSIPVMTFTVYSSDGTETKTYTISAGEPPVKLAIAGGEISYHATLASAFSAIPVNEVGTVTLLKDIQTEADFGTTGGITISNKTVTLTTLTTESTGNKMIEAWGNRTASFFTVAASGHLILEGTSTAQLTLEGGGPSYTHSQPLITVEGSGAVLTMGQDVSLQNNHTTVGSGGGAVRVAGNALFNFSGGAISGNTNEHNVGIYLNANSQLAMSGSATVGTGNVIYLGKNGIADTAWASITVPAAFTGAAVIRPETAKAGMPVVRGTGGYTPGSAELDLFTLNIPTDAPIGWLVYEPNDGQLERRLARKYFISNSGDDITNTGTGMSPFRTPRTAIENVLPSGTAEFVFLDNFVNGQVGHHMEVTTHAGIEAWMYIDGGKKISLAGSGTDTPNYHGFNGLTGTEARPVLWIDGGAQVTLKDYMRIEGASYNDNSDPISLVTVMNGRLIFKDRACVVTEGYPGDYDEAKARQTVGIQENGFGLIQVDEAITPTYPIYVRILDPYAHGQDPVGGDQVLTGNGVISSYFQFGLHAPTGWNIDSQGRVETSG